MRQALSSWPAAAAIRRSPGWELSSPCALLIEMAWLDAAVLQDGRGVGLARNAARARSEGDEHDEDDERAGDEQPDQGRVVQHAGSARFLLARHVDVGDVHDGRQQEEQDVLGNDADHAGKSLWCMFLIIPAVAPQMYLSSNGMA